MNVFQRCPSTAELEPLYLPQQLYLRPTAKLTFSLQLPNVKKLGKSISHWEIMDKVKELIKPDEFTVLKVTKTTIEFVRFEAEVDKRSKLERVISKIDNRMIKLKDFSDLIRIRASQHRSEFPNRRVWDAFFSEAKNMDEMKPGERPDTVHVANLPSKWFIPYHLTNEDEGTPSEKIFYRIFEKFGNIRYVDIPICDPYRKKMKDQISGLKYSSFDKMEWFEGYVQFKDYIGFTKAMDFFRDKKLVHKEEDGEVEVEIKIDFDKSKHLSDASIKRREIVRDRLVKKAKEKEDKEQKELEEKQRQEEEERKKEENIKTQKEIRQRMREEKRKAKLLKKLEINGSDEINDKIAREEKKLIKVQRKLEAIRLVEELFRRIKEKNYGDVQRYEISDPGRDELKRLKNHSELSFLSQKEKLHNAVKGRVMLKSILSESVKSSHFSESSDSELSLDEDPRLKKVKNFPLHVTPHPDMLYEDGPSGHPLYGFPYQALYPPFQPRLFPEIDIFSMYRGGRRGMLRPGMSRGKGRGRGRGNFNNRHRGGPRGPQSDAFDDYSRRRRSSRDYSYSSRRSRSRSRKRSYTRSRSPSYSRRESRSRSKSRSRSRSRRYSEKRRDRDSRSRSHSNKRKSRSRTRDRSPSKERRSRRSRSDSKSTRKNDRSRSKSRRRSQEDRNGKSRSKSRSREKSVDSAKFMTPKELSQQKEQRARSRSKS